MPFLQFETGKWYRFTGHERGAFWNNRGQMDFVLDNKPHFCIYGSGSNANFKTKPRSPGNIQDYWNWSSLFYLWEEVSLLNSDLVELEFYPHCSDKLV